jgi:dihydrofolate reductase
MIGPYAIHGYAIVSADDRIAGADGRMPAELHNEADWALFQAALDRAAVTVIGRLGHALTPNNLGRNRLVLSSSAPGIERRPDATWWNPAEATVLVALKAAAPTGGLAVVVGGKRVFDLFLEIGFDEFHLTRMPQVLIPGGIAVFSEIEAGRRAEDVLAGNGLAPGELRRLDEAADVSLAVWRPVISNQESRRPECTGF